MISTVHLLKDRSYVAISTVTTGDVEAEFRVKLSPRRTRRSFRGKTYTHHLKTLEMLDEEALLKVVRFCEKVAKDQNA